MGQVIHSRRFRRPPRVLEHQVTTSGFAPMLAYYCTRCDTDRFVLYPSGLIRCANCGVDMGNIQVVKSNNFKDNP